MGFAFGRQLVHAGFGRGALVTATVGNEDAGGANAVVEAVAEAFLFGVGEGGELGFERVHPVFLAGDGKRAGAVVRLGNTHAVLRAGGAVAVEEVALQADNGVALPVHG